MNINRKISKYNFNKGSVSRIKYIVIHYVGALGGAEDNCRYYGGGNRNASAHYFVGFNGEVWQCVEDANIAWHCGASRYKHAECRNANSIGIEMCVRKKNTKSMGATDKDWYFEDATVEAAAELTRYLMNKYGVGIRLSSSLYSLPLPLSCRQNLCLSVSSGVSSYLLPHLCHAPNCCTGGSNIPLSAFLPR